jgi:hypothetical protein
MASSNIEQALFVRLQSTTCSTAVYDQFGNRLYWRQAEQGASMPYLVYFVVSDPHTPMAYGTYKDAGQARVQFSVLSSDRYKALTAAKAARDNLDQFSGSMDGVTVVSLNCGGIITHPVEPEDNVFHASFDALIRYVDPT